MFSASWYREFRGAAAYWIASLVFVLVGAVFTAVGALADPAFLLVGVPFLLLGLFVLALLIYSLFLKLKHPERYHTWLWWINFVGGLSGALLFAVPSTFALPILLLADVDADVMWIGALFSAIGVITCVVVAWIAARQFRNRPR